MLSIINQQEKAKLDHNLIPFYTPKIKLALLSIGCGSVWIGSLVWKSSCWWDYKLGKIKIGSFMKNWTYAYISAPKHKLKRNFGTWGIGDAYENFYNRNAYNRKKNLGEK